MNLNEGGSQTIEAKNIILAVGSEVTPLPTCPVDNAGIIHMANACVISRCGAMPIRSMIV